MLFSKAELLFRQRDLSEPTNENKSKQRQKYIPHTISYSSWQNILAMKTNDIRGIVEMIADKRRVTPVENYRPSWWEIYNWNDKKTCEEIKEDSNDSEPLRTLTF